MSTSPCSSLPPRGPAATSPTSWSSSSSTNRRWSGSCRQGALRLLAFSHSDARLLITTLVAAKLCIVGVFAGRHLWTFRDGVKVRKPVWLGFIQFNSEAAVSSLGLSMLIINLLTLRVGLRAYVSIPTSVVAVFLWNWTCDSKFMWRKRSLDRAQGGCGGI